jgi:hypothetical protein
MPFGFLNIILLHSDHRHVSAVHVVIFRMVSAQIQIYLQYVGITPHLKSYSFGFSSLLCGW